MDATLIQHGRTSRINQDAWRHQKSLQASTKDSPHDDSTDFRSSSGLISNWAESITRGLPLVIKEAVEVLLTSNLLAWLRHSDAERSLEIKNPKIEQGALITKVVHRGAFVLVRSSTTGISPYVDLLLDARRLKQPSAGQVFRSAFQEKAREKVVPDHGLGEELLYRRRRELQKKRRLNQINEVEAVELASVENRIKFIQSGALDSDDEYLLYCKKTQEFRSSVDALESRILEILSYANNQKNDSLSE